MVILHVYGWLGFMLYPLLNILLKAVILSALDTGSPKRLQGQDVATALKRMRIYVPYMVVLATSNRTDSNWLIKG
jgi:hypothetical protein